jgi:hypothetical protein
MIGEYNYEEALEKAESIAETKQKEFNLGLPVLRIDNFVRRGRLPANRADAIKKLWEACETALPGQCDIQFTLDVKSRRHRNEYAYYDSVFGTYGETFKIFDKFVIDTDQIEVIVYFPEINISNSEGITHLIKDIFIYIPIKISVDGGVDYFQFSETNGVRSTITLSEYKQYYAHSHLPSKYFNTRYDNERAKLLEPDRFCRGSGDLVAVEMLLNNDFSYELFQLYLHELQPFLEWESLEGVPYRRIKNVKGNREYFNITSAYDSEGVDFYNYLCSDFQNGSIEPNLDWRFVDNKYVITDNSKFDQLLRAGHVRDTMSNCFFLRDDDGGYYRKSGVRNPIRFDYPEVWMPFRGNRFHFKVEPDESLDEPEPKNEDYFVYPKIKSYVRNRLEYTAQASQIRASGIRRINTRQYPR